MAASQPLATAVVAILVVATTAVPLAAAAADKYSGRMVIIRAPGARVVVDYADSAFDKWQQQRRRLVEDDVAPEFGGGLLGAGEYVGGALNSNRPTCLHGQCTQPGQAYTRPCAGVYNCPNGPTAGNARTVHV